MLPKITPATWIWVVVQNPGGDEQFLGQHDDKKDVAFIPAFYEKGDAQQAIGQLITERGKKYEAQAILFEELAPDQETNKPVCIDCHGVHGIKKTDDPEGTVFQSNLLQTCQRCHPDATENFSASWLSHYSPEPGKATLVWLATWVYRILIPVVVGGMLLYVFALVARKRRSARTVPA